MLQYNNNTLLLNNEIHYELCAFDGAKILWICTSKVTIAGDFKMQVLEVRPWVFLYQKYCKR